MMNITFDSCYTGTLKDIHPGDVFSIGDSETVYLMTDFNRYINLRSGFSYPFLAANIPVRIYDASLTLRPKT